MNPCDFFELTVADKVIEISETSRHAILAEIRKSDLDENLWNSYGTIDAFEPYIENCLRQVSQLDKCVQYRSSEKNGYLWKRNQVPDDSRDDLYKLSGKCGIQFRAIRFGLLCFHSCLFLHSLSFADPGHGPATCRGIPRTTPFESP